MINRATISGRLLLAFFCFAIAASHSEGSDQFANSVVLFIERNGEFEVLHSRAETTGIGFILFGLIGYGVEEGSRASEDASREDAIFAEVPEDACRSYFLEAFSERLKERQYEVKIIESRVTRVADNAYVIRLRISACGFRKVNTTSDELSAFFSGEYEILRPGESSSNDFQAIAITGQDRQDWNEFIGDVDSTIEEFRSVKAKAGRRLANKLIFLPD